MTPDRIHNITSSRLSINVAEWGDPDAPPLILQHGGRDHCRSWDAVVAEFVGDYRVIAPDLRGHGDSEWANDGDYGAFDFLYDFVAVIDALELPPCAIIGHSLGGSIALRFAGYYPDRVTRFVNIEGLSLSPSIQAEIDATDPGDYLRDWFKLRRQMLGWTPKRYADVETVAKRLREVDERLTAELADHLAREGTRANDDGSVSLKYDPAFHGRTIVDIDMETRYDMWRRVTCPTLFIYGHQSFASNPREDGWLVHFNNARLVMLEDAGHWVHHDRHESFVGLAKPFLAGGWDALPKDIYS